MYLFLERGEGRERQRETSMCGCFSRAPYWGLAHNPGMCPDWESNQQHFGSQADTQSTEPRQPPTSVIKVSTLITVLTSGSDSRIGTGVGREGQWFAFFKKYICMHYSYN